MLVANSKVAALEAALAARSVEAVQLRRHLHSARQAVDPHIIQARAGCHSTPDAGCTPPVRHCCSVAPPPAVTSQRRLARQFVRACPTEPSSPLTQPYADAFSCGWDRLCWACVAGLMRKAALAVTAGPNGASSTASLTDLAVLQSADLHRLRLFITRVPSVYPSVRCAPIPIRLAVFCSRTTFYEVMARMAAWVRVCRCGSCCWTPQ